LTWPGRHDIQHDDPQHNGIQHKDTQYKGLFVTFITTFSINDYYYYYYKGIICDTQHNYIQHNSTLSVIMLNVVMLSVVAPWPGLRFHSRPSFLLLYLFFAIFCLTVLAAAAGLAPLTLGRCSNSPTTVPLQLTLFILSYTTLHN
jgi:hypothetical protein